MSDPTDDADHLIGAYLIHARSLADALDDALGPWVVRSVEAVLAAAGASFDDHARALAEAAAERCRREVGPALRKLLTTDPDEQVTTPLALLRGATNYATGVLRELGAAPVERDEFASRSFPEDVYGLAPASFSEVGQRLHEPALVWGAAKAHVHLSRRRDEGRR